MILVLIITCFPLWELSVLLLYIRPTCYQSSCHMTHAVFNLAGVFGPTLRTGWFSSYWDMTSTLLFGFCGTGKSAFLWWDRYLSELRLILEAFHLFKAFPSTDQLIWFPPPGRSGLTNPVREFFFFSLPPDFRHSSIHGIVLASSSWIGTGL